ncbi:MAG TPA: hypothetical protein VFV81_01545 [Verrucomicrobiae bacterium]|nr:hypothetical protein [Verrucomicrobiae bacterium]
MKEWEKVASTGRDGWQKRCREWAQDGESFQLHGVTAAELAFCKGLCDEFGYQCDYDSRHPLKAAIFSPAIGLEDWKPA